MNQGRPLELTWSERQGRTCLRILGWAETESRIGAFVGSTQFAGLSKLLSVLPNELVEAGVDLRNIQPIAGRFELDQDAVYFIPRFPFVDGMCYALLVDSASEGNSPEVLTIQRPSPEAKPTTEVVAIYPTVDQLPVNQLKLYVHFSSPMSEDWAERSVRVRRADNNQPLEDVFVPMGPGLWDPERHRLTLLLDPGRIKRGLVPNEEAGYPLIEGVPIVVTIDACFRDAAGRPLRASVERCYEIGPPLRIRIDPSNWRIHAPTAGSLDPLTVEFDRPLDHALLQHSLWVNNRAGVPLSGRGDVGPGEQSWRFTPDTPWEEGQHHLVVDPRLEDLAGNSVLRVFDRDLMNSEDAPLSMESVTIDFTCPPAPALIHPEDSP